MLGGAHFWNPPANCSGNWSEMESGRGGRKVVGGSSSTQFCFVFPSFLLVRAQFDSKTESGRGGSESGRGSIIQMVFGGGRNGCSKKS